LDDKRQMKNDKLDAAVSGQIWDGRGGEWATGPIPQPLRQHLLQWASEPEIDSLADETV
jgi:hypothetical protein